MEYIYIAVLTSTLVQAGQVDGSRCFRPRNRASITYTKVAHNGGWALRNQIWGTQEQMLEVNWADMGGLHTSPTGGLRYHSEREAMFR